MKTEPCGSIRRINVEIPSLSLSDMRRLKATDKVRGVGVGGGVVLVGRGGGERGAHADLGGRGAGERASQAAQPPASPLVCFRMAQIGTFTLFQETYHRPTFKHMHIAGPKSGGWVGGGCAGGRGAWAGRRWVPRHEASGRPPSHPPPPHTRHTPHTPPTDYDNRIHTFDRAMRAGLDDVGIGALFGLYDYRFEVRRGSLP